MSLTWSRHKVAAVNRKNDSFQSLTFICLAVDRGDRKVNSLIAALSSGDKLCIRDVGIYCSSQPTISKCLFWIGSAQEKIGNVFPQTWQMRLSTKDWAGNTVQNQIPLQRHCGMLHALFPWSTTSSLIKNSVNSMSLSTALPFCFHFRISLDFFHSLLSTFPISQHVNFSFFVCFGIFSVPMEHFDHTSLPSQQLLTPHFQPLFVLLWTVVWSALWWAVWGCKCFNIRVGRLASGWLKYTNPSMTNMKCPRQVYIENLNTLAQSSTLSLLH